MMKSMRFCSPNNIREFSARHLALGAVVALLLALLPPGLQARPVLPFSPTNPVVGDSLSAEILAKLAEANLGERTRLGVLIQERERGVTHVSINADEQFTPASLLKLVTTAAALETLGTEFRFTTTVEATGPINNGILQGNLIVRGGGDPSLGARFRQGRPTVTGLLDDWAADLRRRGLRNIQGNIIGNEDRYERDPLAMGWERLEVAEWYSAEVSALNYNENVIDVLWKGASKPGELAKYTLIPQTDFVVFSSSVRTGTVEQTAPRLRYFRFPESNDIRARGSLPPNFEKYDFAAIHDPARYTAQLFLQSLEKAGIRVAGVAANRSLIDQGALDTETTETQVLITHESPSLAEMVKVINTKSQNLYAETLLREMAIAKETETTFAGGSDAVAKWLRDRNLNRPGFLMVDGSGLSPVNRVTPRVLANVLRYVSGTEFSGIYKSSLATPGEGSLAGRFDGMGKMRNDLYAKTGFLGGSHAIAGYFTNHRGTEYVFVIIINDYNTRRSREARDFIDDIVATAYGSRILP